MEVSIKQQEIIDYNENEDILVIACPGSGKTHTIICKYIKIIKNNIFQSQEIILITFTKKAGKELFNRLKYYIPDSDPYYVGTIHGLAYKILKLYNNNNYTILDDDDYKKYIISVIPDNTHDIIKSNIILIYEQYTNTYPLNLKKILIKNKLEKYYDEYNNIYKLYKNKKKKDNIIDFNDLMILFSKFLKSDKSDEFKNNIKYIFFDEYQDINSIQYFILSELNKKSNLMLVGDDAQSIYSFRGSNIDYILNFKKKIFILEENFRSSSHIINYYRYIISYNNNKIDKNIISINDNNNIKPSLYQFESYLSLYKWLSNYILNKKNKGYNLNDMVIISRVNYILDNIELELLKNKIPYTKQLKSQLLNKSHIKDFISFIIILYNPKSKIHWKRVLCLNNNYSIEEVSKLLESNKNIFQILKTIPECNNLLNLINNIKNYTCTEKILSIYEYFKNNFNFSDNNLLEIKNIINLLNNNNKLNDFINNIYINEEITDNINNIYLTTIHGSKGLEWKYVYLIDYNNNNNKIIDINEERRLLYVAASRAKYKLIILNVINKKSLLNNIDKKLYNKYIIT